MKANIIACYFWVWRVTVSQPMTRKLLSRFAEMHIISSTRYKHTLVGNHFVKCNKCKRILISFNCCFSIVKLGFTGVHIFPFFALNHCLGTHTLWFRAKIRKKTSHFFFHLKITIFTAVKNQSLLHRRIIVLSCLTIDNWSPISIIDGKIA